MNQSIPLSQKLYLLGIHPEKGGMITAASSVMNYVLAGSVFLELFLDRNIIFDQKRVVLQNDKTSDELHRFVIDKMKKKPAPVKMSRWLSRLNFSQGFIKRNVQQELEAKRIIKMEQHRFLFITWRKPKIINKQIVYQLISEIDNKIFRNLENEEDVLFLSMLKPAGLLKRIFPEREKRNKALERLKKMEVDNQVSVAVSEAIAAARAVAASVVITSVAAGAHR